MSNQEADVLRCWRCRKYVANSVCLEKSHKKEPSDASQPSSAAQEPCNVWHVNLEAIPEWVKCVIEKAQWTIGKLHCPFCEARLGGFNFVCNKKCSCGQLVNIHFCKSRTDYQPAFSIKFAKSPGKHLPLLKIHSGFSKDSRHELVTATLEIKNQGLLCMARNNKSTGRLTEALCLEVRAPSFERRSKAFPLNQKRSISTLYPMNDACTVKSFHRRSHSLDLSIRERLVLSPPLYETIYHSQNKNPPVYTQSGLQLESNREDVHPLKDLSSSSADKLQKRFQVTSFTTLLHKETENECDFEAPGQSSGNAIADGSPFVMNLSSPTSAMEEEQYISPVDFLQPTSISFSQRLSKRERNKLKSLRRKQRRRERWLQKQTANDNLHTDDEHDLRRDKESYLCAVCLDIYFNPYMCYPCHHIFCEPCLRMLAKDNPASTPCPLCRTTIARVFFQAELNNSTKSFFPTEYLKLKENFQKSNSAKWPLPSCKKAFRVFEGFQRRSDTVTRRHFPHAAHRMDYMDFEDDSRVWRFDMDMVIIYIYSVNWVIGFIVFCFLCYFFFPFSL
ncbi:E3 ubiquitin-protein ligase RNF180 [Neopsephotus bourkii]|uniref:E3 ubiquitin-protein ligase RNF180 n=1 Tax=Neopsephotus bourkii TaxID=309878 RepID=UPI002AA56859|nr:E3 ubiquitin-protein ligase RNF180 [Neopsephotus bourkii]XP_061198659.1 E3 ubiquitin-protein ligase RNF180 [Neopsephotus bourkii]XP_061198660.1 E3 ubiquitin-protein ligase RNF180 [Neopsephotus bourkii]